MEDRGRDSLFKHPCQVVHMPFRFGDIVKRLSTVTDNANRELIWIIQSVSGMKEHHIRNIAQSKGQVGDESLDLSSVLSNSQLAKVLANVDERVDKRKPLQYIIGDVDFCNLKLSVKPPVLIPRPETEQMCSWLTYQLKTYKQAKSSEAADNNFIMPADDATDRVDSIGGFPIHKFRFSWFNSIAKPNIITNPTNTDDSTPKSAIPTNARLRLLDICSGSGNIALALAGQFPDGECVGLELDPIALALARQNAEQLGFKNVSFYSVDIFKDQGPTQVTSKTQFDRDITHSLYDMPVLTGLYDTIISNPPYIHPDRLSQLQPEIRDWENPIALAPTERCYPPTSGFKPTYVDVDTVLCPNGTIAPAWPSTPQVKQLSITFYERMTKVAPRLLNHVHHDKTKSHIQFPRVVYEIGDDDQAEPLCRMLSHMFEPNIYLDANEKMRWVVGFEKRQ